MSDQYIAKYCAPTLAGIKTGSLFTAAYTDRDTLTQELRELNGVLTRHGLRAIPLRYTRRAYPQTVARECKGLAHAELVLMFPERFAREVARFLNE